MTNWGAILATVAGGGVAGAGEGWSKDIKSKGEDAREARRQKALEIRETNLTNLRQTYATQNIELSDTLDRRRSSDEFTRKQAADETNYNRRQREEELTFQRRMKEKLESEKQLIQMQKGKVDGAVINAQEKAIDMCNKLIVDNEDNITPDIVARINDIRTTAGLSKFDYRPTGQKVKDEDTGFLGFGKKDKDVYGFFPSGDTQDEGILAGGEPVKQPKPNVGNVEFDDLFKEVNKPDKEGVLSKTSDVDTSDGGKDKPLLASKKDDGKDHDVNKINDKLPPDKKESHAQLLTAAKQLALRRWEYQDKSKKDAQTKALLELAKELGISKEDWKATGQLYKDIGGWMWESYQNVLNALNE